VLAEVTVERLPMTGEQRTGESGRPTPFDRLSAYCASMTLHALRPCVNVNMWNLLDQLWDELRSRGALYTSCFSGSTGQSSAGERP
jgi:hypothetical protein